MIKFLKAIPAKFAVLIPASIFVIVLACTGESGAKDKPKFTFKEGQGPAGAVATIDGKPVTEDELIGEDKLEFIEAQKKVYDLRMSGIGRVLLNHLYEEPAKQASMSLDEYIEKKVFKGEPKISDKEYNAFVKEKHIPKEQLNDQLKQRILSYMKAQKHQEQLEGLIAKLSRDHKIEIYFNKPNMKINVEVGQAPTTGSQSAKVKIVEFSDFQCPFCSRAAEIVNQVKKAYSNKVQIAFKQYPLPMHPQAKPAAEAALCVHEQNADKYWQYHDKLFANQDKLDPENLKKFAKEVGANLEKFNQCFDSHKFAKTIQDDMDYGNRLGVRSTPTFFINGRVVSGAQPFESFKEIIDEELSSGT